ncbi:MAG: DUF5689 domain-containing protein, partial [Lutibacter sp.]|nr:DUF5689 domain-containing protein [Lutibacter sp.]
MKTSKALNIILSCLLLLGLGISCVQDDEYDTPTISCDEPDIAVNATIADVKALYNGSLIQISDDLVIEGYVVSNDEAGNFYRTLHFQDALENPTEGFQLDVDLQDMYATYQVGRKIYLSVQGLYLDNYKGVLKLGGIYENSSGDLSIGRLSAEQAASRLFRACEGPQTVSPAATSIDMISDQMINTLIQLDNVEVAPESLCQNYALEGENTNIVLKDCNGNEIILRNSGYSTFYKDLLPLGSGSVVAVLGKYGSDFQLTIRDTNDVSMSNPRCDGSTFTCEAPEPTVSIQDIKNLYEGSLVQITGDMVFDATVTANDISGNLYKYIYVQDETAGIKVKINQKDLYLRGYEVGQQITVNATDLYLGDYGGEIQLGGLYNGNIGNIDEEAVYKHLFLGEANTPLDATVITMDAITADQVGMFVQLADVQFSDENEIFASSSASATNRSLVDCNANSIVVRTSKYADFAGNTLPAGNGPIFGILNVYNGTYQLLLRDANDVAGMTNTKCDIYAGAVQKTLAEVRGMFTGQSMTIEENIKITAVITSDMTAANIYPTNAFAQDATAGIALRFDDDHSLELGNEVSIALLGVALEEYNGLLQLNNIPLGNITATATGTLPTPTAISLAEALTGNYESMLVSIADVQFKTA